MCTLAHETNTLLANATKVRRWAQQGQRGRESVLQPQLKKIYLSLVQRLSYIDIFYRATRVVSVIHCWVLWTVR